MNLIHNMICSSRWWARRVERDLLPWGLEGVELGDDVLELGPGFGATTRRLVRLPGKLTVLELDPGYCARLRSELGSSAAVVQGDATELPFADDRFSSAVCFTMLHHIPARSLQDQTLREVARVLRPGGWFAGTDSVGTGSLFKLIHLGDTLLPIDPGALPARLAAAGLAEPSAQRAGGSFRFRARKPLV